MAQSNVISHAKSLPTGARGDFPAMYWLPDGTSYVAKDESEVQKGSTPSHPEHAVHNTGHPTLTKEETLAQLTAGGIEHDPKQSHKKLYTLLLAGVKNALTAANIAFDEASNDAKALLELFP